MIIIIVNNQLDFGKINNLLIRYDENRIRKVEILTIDDA
jgi:hypothetical protein